jgi:single-strand DNA-binding protein
MSIDLNKVQLIGRCTATVNTKIIEPSKIAVVNFTVVTNRKYKNAQSVVMSDSEYHKCTAYGNSADILGKYLTKGKKIYVEGRLKTRKRTDGA